jgi:hypothetical protein
MTYSDPGEQQPDSTDPKQGGLFDLDAGREARDRAIEQVAQSVPLWINGAIEAIGSIPSGLFTTDDVWARVGKPPEPRAMGAAMTRARAMGICKPTDSWQQSARPECHARPVRVWSK